MIAESYSEHVKEAVRTVEGLLVSNTLCAFGLSHLLVQAKEAIRERCFDESRDFRKALKSSGWKQYSDRLTFDGEKDYALMNAEAAEAVTTEQDDKTGLLREIVKSTHWHTLPM